ncbi:MAG: alpha/beta fold hydrolase [Pseudomonadota bacterium]
MSTPITRHILTVPAQNGRAERKVHYRRCGSGPALLMVHQSPRSSGEYAELMQLWSEHFTCIAPDTPGFGQSDPLSNADPDINDFADALCEFLDALGIEQCPAYGFHSGGIILVTAVKRQPKRFTALAIGGYAIWTEEEMRIFGESYLPEFHPATYGEHLTWLWNRMLEQTWVFPWFDTREEARLSVAHADLPRVTRAVSEMLDAGNAYRAGYGAVLRAPRDIPPVGADVPACLITAYDGDPLQPHIDRLGEMPTGWSAHKVKTPADHQAASLAFLIEQVGDGHSANLIEDQDEGWLVLDDGLIHWKGQRGAERLVLHSPACELAEPNDGEIAIDAPGHGQSDDFDDIGAAIENAAMALGTKSVVWPDPPVGEPEQLYPGLTPDRFGSYLQRAWSIARAEAFFEPWYEASAAHAIALDQTRLAPLALQKRARARLRAGDAARRWHEFLLDWKGTNR